MRAPLARSTPPLRSLLSLAITQTRSFLDPSSWWLSSLGLGAAILHLGSVLVLASPVSAAEVGPGRAPSKVLALVTMHTGAALGCALGAWEGTGAQLLGLVELVCGLAAFCALQRGRPYLSACIVGILAHLEPQLGPIIAGPMLAAAVVRPGQGAPEGRAALREGEGAQGAAAESAVLDEGPGSAAASPLPGQPASWTSALLAFSVGLLSFFVTGLLSLLALRAAQGAAAPPLEGPPWSVLGQWYGHMALWSDAGAAPYQSGPGIPYLGMPPNEGLWWYLDEVMFPEARTPFRAAFVSLSWLLPGVCLTGAIRGASRGAWAAEPGFLFILVWGLAAFFRSRPSLLDWVGAATLMCLFPAHMARMPLLPLLAVLAPPALASLGGLRYQWLGMGRINSNFYYAGNLVWGGVQALALNEMVGALVGARAGSVSATVTGPAGG